MKTLQITFPADHEAGMRVPRGGSMCKNCKFLADAENRICNEENFIAWDGGEEKPAGSDKIPYAIDEYCSDFYMPKQGEKLRKEEAGKMTFSQILNDTREAEYK